MLRFEVLKWDCSVGKDAKVWWYLKSYGSDVSSFESFEVEPSRLLVEKYSLPMLKNSFPLNLSWSSSSSSSFDIVRDLLWQKMKDKEVDKKQGQSI